MVMQQVLISIAFGALMHACTVFDFSVTNVYENSHSAKPGSGSSSRNSHGESG